MTDELPEVVSLDVSQWRHWLGEHWETAPGAWVLLAKKGTTEPTRLSYEQAVEEALCHGWIDGKARRHDEATYWLRVTPRRARSPWSGSNVGRVARLQAEGRMRPAGQAEVDRAKADGRWDAAGGK